MLTFTPVAPKAAGVLLPGHLALLPSTLRRRPSQLDRSATWAWTLSIDPRTLYTWRRKRAFQRALRQRRREVWSSASDRLRSMLDQSLDVFESYLMDRYQTSRFRAASAILRIAGVGKGVIPPPKAQKRPQQNHS